MEEWDWQRIAMRIVDRRLLFDMKHTTSLAERSLLSSRLLGDIENARRRSYSKETIRTLERTLGWLPGSIEAIGTGGEPTDIPGFIVRGSRPRKPYRSADLSDVSDEELRRRWRVLELRRAEIELEYGDRHGLSMAESVRALDAPFQRRTAGDDPAAGTGTFLEVAARQGELARNSDAERQAIAGEESQETES